MRTLPFVAVFLVVACVDNSAPHGANFGSVDGLAGATCGRTENQLRCWGDLSLFPGQYSTATPRQPGAPYNSLQVIRSSPYYERSCGLDQGSLYCWGWNESFAPKAPALRFTDVTVGWSHTCALAAGGTVYCWGLAQYSGVADADPSIVECDPGNVYTSLCVREPTAIAITERFTAISAGDNFTCAVTQGRQVFCWGDGYDGELGMGEDVQFTQTPMPISSTDQYSAVSTAGYRACAITSSGGVQCWGRGALGNGTYESFVPVAATIPTGVSMRSVTSASGHSCALDTSNAAWCWGSGGTGSASASSPVPTPVLGGLTFSSLAAGNGFTCGVRNDGAWCWGANGAGQLGNGGTTSSPIPVRVAGQDQFDD